MNRLGGKGAIDDSSEGGQLAGSQVKQKSIRRCRRMTEYKKFCSEMRVEEQVMVAFRQMLDRMI